MRRLLLPAVFLLSILAFFALPILIVHGQAPLPGGSGGGSSGGAGTVTSSGGITAGHCAQFSTATNIVDAGAGCGGAGVGCVTYTTNCIPLTQLAGTFVWQNQGTATETIFNGIAVLDDNTESSYTGIHVRSTAIATCPYRYRVNLTIGQTGNSFPYNGMVLTDSGGSAIVWGFIGNGGTAVQLRAQKFSSISGGAGGSIINYGINLPLQNGSTNVWLQWRDDCTNYHWDISGDGIIFTPLGTDTTTAFLNPATSVGYFSSGDSTNGVSETAVRSWAVAATAAIN